MKSIKILLLCLLVALVASCSPKHDPQPAGITKADVDTASYAIGVNFGQVIKMNNLGDLNFCKIFKGMKDALSEKEGLDQQFVMERINGFMQKRNTVLAEANKKEGEEFLAKNATAEGVVVAASGLQYKIVRAGNGVKPTSAQDTVEVNYEGKGLDGKVFDTTYDKEKPIKFPLNRVIPGWTEGLQYCDEGSEVTLWIPSDLAYRERGPMGPNATLIFKVELVKVYPFVPKEEEVKK